MRSHYIHQSNQLGAYLLLLVVCVCHVRVLLSHPQQLLVGGVRVSLCSLYVSLHLLYHPLGHPEPNQLLRLLLGVAGVLRGLGQLQDVTEDHQVGFAASGGHQVGLGQPLLVSLVARVLEQLRVFDVQAAPGLSESECLVGPGAEYEERVLLQPLRLPLGALPPRERGQSDWPSDHIAHLTGRPALFTRMRSVLGRPRPDLMIQLFLATGELELRQEIERLRTWPGLLLLFTFLGDSSLF